MENKIQVRHIEIGGKKVLGVTIPTPNSNLLMVSTPKGYIMCGYLNIETAERLGDCAAVVKGVKNLDELLEGRVVEITNSAKKSGIKIGMKGIKALSKII